MRKLKLFLCWYFAFASVVFLLAAFELFASVAHSKDRLELLLNTILGGLFAAVAIILVMAWWTNFREATFARRWATVASLLNLLIFIGTPLIYCYVHGWVAFREIERLFWIPTLIGAAVFVVFSLPSSRVNEPTVGQTSN